MKTLIKRDGKQVEFNGLKIKFAIENAMMETPGGVDENLSSGIAAAIERQIEKTSRLIHVEDIQDLVEDFLMASDRKEVAKKFIIYRYERDNQRRPQTQRRADNLRRFCKQV